MLNLNYPALWNMGSGHPVLLVYIYGFYTLCVKYGFWTSCIISIYMGSTHHVLSIGSGHPVNIGSWNFAIWVPNTYIVKYAFWTSCIVKYVF